MSNIKIELNREGVRELLQSDEMMEICEGLANNALANLGEGYAVTAQRGKTRVNAQIRAETYKARRDNLKNNTILKALRSG